MPEKKYEPSALAVQVATDLKFISNNSYNLSSMSSEERDRSVVSLMSDAIRTGAYNMLFPQRLEEKKEEKQNA